MDQFLAMFGKRDMGQWEGGGGGGGVGEGETSPETGHK